MGYNGKRNKVKEVSKGRAPVLLAVGPMNTIQYLVKIGGAAWLKGSNLR